MSEDRVMDMVKLRLVSLCEDCGRSWGKAEVQDYDFSRETCRGCGSAHVHAVVKEMEAKAQAVSCPCSGDAGWEPKSERERREAEGKTGEHFPLTASKLVG